MYCKKYIYNGNIITDGDFVERAELLGVSICCDVKDKNINGSVQKFYCKVNSVLYDYKDIPCDVKTRLLDKYCLDLYWVTIVEL